MEIKTKHFLLQVTRLNDETKIDADLWNELTVPSESDYGAKGLK